MQKKEGQSFLHGAVILAAATALIKIIGALFKIPLGNMLDSSGYAYFTMAYNAFTVLLIISTSGLPVAVSKMVSEALAKDNWLEIKRIFNVAIFTFAVLGAVFSVGMFVFARDIAVLMGDEGCTASIQVLAPAVFFVALSSAFRGYYQGFSNMYPTAISQVIEAICKLVVGYTLVSFIISLGYSQEYASAGSIVGVTFGSVLSVAYLTVIKLREKNRLIVNQRGVISLGAVLKKLFSISIPIMLGSSVLSITNMIDTMQIVNRLRNSAGFAGSRATEMFGDYGLSQNLFNLPGAFIIALSVSIVPVLSASRASGNTSAVKGNIESGLRIGALLSLPCAIGLSILSEPILNLLYPLKPDSIPVASQALGVLGIAVFFQCMVLILNAILQALGKERLPLIAMIIGSVVKILVNWVLVGIPSINIKGAPVGTLLCYIIIMAGDLIFLIKSAKIRVAFSRIFLKPAICAAVMGVASWAFFGLFSRFIDPRLGVVLTIVAAGICYVILALFLKAITREDMLLLPHGEKIANILKL